VILKIERKIHFSLFGREIIEKFKSVTCQKKRLVFFQKKKKKKKNKNKKPYILLLFFSKKKYTTMDPNVNNNENINDVFIKTLDLKNKLKIERFNKELVSNNKIKTGNVKETCFFPVYYEMRDTSREFSFYTPVITEHSSIEFINYICLHGKFPNSQFKRHLMLCPYLDTFIIRNVRFVNPMHIKVLKEKIMEYKIKCQMVMGSFVRGVETVRSSYSYIKDKPTRKCEIVKTQFDFNVDKIVKRTTFDFETDLLLIRDHYRADMDDESISFDNLKLTIPWEKMCMKFRVSSIIHPQIKNYFLEDKVCLEIIKFNERLLKDSIALIGKGRDTLKIKIHFREQPLENDRKKEKMIYNRELQMLVKHLFDVQNNRHALICICCNKRFIEHSQ
jgi:hypothetical protein